MDIQYIPRAIESHVDEKIRDSRKILIIYGSRQVGKTTLINHVLKSFGGRILFVNADQAEFKDVLSSRDLRKMKMLVSGYDLLCIDEAQRITDIGINLKILYDQLPELQIIATGSSSFELANQISEPLTGRTWTYQLYPIALSEWCELENEFEIHQRTEEFLQFGMYPEVFSIGN